MVRKSAMRTRFKRAEVRRCARARFVVRAARGLRARSRAVQMLEIGFVWLVEGEGGLGVGFRDREAVEGI
jgi:hypothetical protein